MADEALSRAGLHFDELNKIRVLEPDVATQTVELKEDCKEFVDKLTEFKTIVGSFTTVVDEVGAEVEATKMKAIGSRNLLKSVAKQRESQQQQLHALIGEKTMQLERLRIQYEALQRVEKEQLEFMDTFVQQK